MNCGKCPDKPKLIPPWESKNLPFTAPAHWTQSTKVMCKGCGYDFARNIKGKAVWRCTKCNDYFVCSNCKLCKSGHGLFKCYSLKLKGQGGYKNNNYRCDHCLVSKTVREGTDIPFVWHCNPCQYDACPTHFYPKMFLSADHQQHGMESSVTSSLKPFTPQAMIINSNGTIQQPWHDGQTPVQSPQSLAQVSVGYSNVGNVMPFSVYPHLQPSLIQSSAIQSGSIPIQSQPNVSPYYPFSFQTSVPDQNVAPANLNLNTIQPLLAPHHPPSLQEELFPPLPDEELHLEMDSDSNLFD